MSASRLDNEPIAPLGPFNLISFLGKGAMGQVWYARHREQRVDAAVKIITGKQARREDFRHQFRHEVRAVAGLSHPGIVMVFDYGTVTEEVEEATLGGLRAGSPYLAMELCPKGSLSGLKKRLSFEHIRSVLLSLLDALAHAHARGVIHRDLKPANILLGDDTDWTGVKLTDFGLAFVPERLETDDFSRKGACGTPAYMPPEQLLGKWRDIGPWCDLYSLGCVAYQLVCGEAPYTGTSIVEVAKKHLRRPIPRLRPKIAVPEEFEGWIRRLLQKDPRHRFRNAADAAWQLLLMSEPDPTTVVNEEEVDAYNFASRKSTLVLKPFDNLLGTTDRRDQMLASYPVLPEMNEPAVKGAVDPIFVHAQAPLPSSWHHLIGRRPSIQLLGAGLGLYGLRHIPMVGRESEREQLWQSLRAVVRDSTPQAVMLRGAAGTGKSFLAEWLCERALETGAALRLKASHSPSPGGAEGLSTMLARHFRTSGLDRAEIVERLRTWFVGRGVHEAYLWDGLAEIIKPATADDVAAGQRKIHFGSSAQRYQLVARVVELICKERAVIIWLDDLQWAGDSVGFLRFMLDSQAFEHLPVLFAITLRDDALADESSVSSEVAQFALDDKVTHISVGKLSHRAHAELIEKLLYLAPSLARRVADRTEGNPLFAVQLIGDWVDRGVLEVDEEGFVLADGEEAPIPDDIFAVWTSRLGEVLLGVTEDQVRALELAATLGLEVDEEEWRACLELAGLAYPSETVEKLLSHRLLEPTDAGVRFVHGMLRESLERRAEMGERRVEHNRVCARMLQMRYEKEPRLAERLGRHLLAAHAYLDALEPLLVGAKARGNAAEYDAALVLLDLRLDAMDALGLPAECAPRAENLALRALALATGAEYDKAHDLASRALRQAHAVGEPDLTVRCYLRMAQCLSFQQGETKRGLHYLEQAFEIATAEGIEETTLMQLSQLLGKSLSYFGRMDEAVVHLNEARRRAAQVGDDLLQASIAADLGSWERRQGNYDKAEAMLRDAVQLAEKIGLQLRLTGALVSLGDIVRLQGRLDESESFYREALDHARSTRPGVVNAVRINLALVCVQRGSYEEASAIIDEIRPEFERNKTISKLLFVDALSLSCLANEEDWEGFDRRLEQLLEQLEAHGLVDADMAICLENAAQLAAGGDYVDLARRAFEAAAVQWEQSGNEEKARAVKRRIDRVTARASGDA